MIQKPIVYLDQNLLAYCEFIKNSELVPKELRGKTAEIYSIVETGTRLGFIPSHCFKAIKLVYGNLTVCGAAAMALIQTHKEFESIKEYYSEDDTIAYCELKRKGRDSITRSFSIEDAKKAELLSRDNWKKYPKRMLQMRARSFAFDDLFADALYGVVILEVAEDYEDFNKAKDVTPQAQTKVVHQNKIEQIKERIAAIEDKHQEITNSYEGANKLKTLIIDNDIKRDIINAWLNKAGVSKIRDMKDEQIDACIKYIEQSKKKDSQNDNETMQQSAA